MDLLVEKEQELVEQLVVLWEGQLEIEEELLLEQLELEQEWEQLQLVQL